MLLMRPRLLLNCDSRLSSFSLTREGQGWRKQFHDLKHALEFAATVVAEDTPLAVYNDVGRVIVESFVNPAIPDESDFS